MKLTAPRALSTILAAFLALIPSLAAQAQVAPASYNLASTQHTVAASSAVVLNIGGHNDKIMAGQMLTAAESLALSQVLQTGHQQLVIGAYGNAVGGSFSISSLIAGAIGSISIPHGVTALDNFAGSALKLSGDLTNGGNFYAYSTSPSVSTAQINALDIVNQHGALLSSVLPSTLGITGATPSLGLNMTAVNNFVNAGTIKSAGDLSIVAGGSITNSLSGAGGIAPLLQAAGNINLQSNSIINSANITALAGNINTTSATNSSILFNNIGGTLQALNGNITVGDSSFAGNSNITLAGGNLLSQQLNAYSGTGNVDLNVEKLTGVVNVNAGTAAVTTNTSDLKLGTLNLSGDPTFYNTAGAITFSTAITTNGANLAVVASGDINESGTSGSAFSITTTPTAGGNGGSVTLVAGARFTTTGPASQLTADTTSILTITGGSPTGGQVNFLGTGTGAVPITGITTSAASDGSGTAYSGGNVMMVAYAGTEKNSGSVYMPIAAGGADAITTSGFSGTGTPQNGSVEVIAGGNVSANAAISIGNINASASGVTSGGTVSLYAATPSLPSPVIIQNGTVVGGSFAPGHSTLGPLIVGSNGSQNTTAADITASGTYTASTGGEYFAPYSTVSSSNVSVTAGTTAITGGIVANSGTLNVSSGGAMDVNGPLLASGNITLATTAGNSNINIQSNISSSSGQVTMTAHGSGAIQGLPEAVNTFQGNFATGSNVGWQFLLGVTATPTALYVPDTHLNTIDVVNPQTGVVMATYTSSAGLDAPEGTALSGSYLFVANSGNQTVSVINTSNGASSTISVGTANPQGVAVAPNGTLYVLADNAETSGTGKGQAYLIPVFTPTTSATVGTPIPLGTAQTQTGGIAINPQGTLAFVSCAVSKNVYTIDIAGASPTQNPTITGTTSLSQFSNVMPFFLAMNPNGTQVDVAQSYINRTTGAIEGSIAYINAVQGTPTFDKVTGSLPLPTSPTSGAGSFPQGIAFNATGTELMIQPTYFSLPKQGGFVQTNYTGTTGAFLISTGYANGTLPNGGGTGGIYNLGADGFGSSAFSTVISNTIGGAPINNLTTYTSNTINLTPMTTGTSFPVVRNTVSQIQEPTVQGVGVTFKSGSGNIFVSYDAKGGAVSANTSGSSVVLSNVGTATSTVGQSSSRGLFELGSLADFNVTGAITAPHITLQTTGAGTAGTGSINVGANVGQSGATVTFNTFAGGSITQSAGTITGSALNINGVASGGSGGNVGTASNPLNTAVSNLSLVTGGSAYILNTGSLILQAATTGGTLILATNNGNISALNSSVQIIAPTALTLNSNAGTFGTSAVPLSFSTNTLDVGTGIGSAYLLNSQTSGTLTLGASTVSSVFSLTTPKNITSTAGLALAGDIKAGTSIVLSTGSGGIINSGYDLLAPAVSITSPGGTVGTNSFPIITNATSLTIGNSSTVSIYGLNNIVPNYALTLNASTATTSFSLEVAGAITVRGALNSPSILLETAPGSNAGIILAANAGNTTTSSVDLLADGQGNIVSAGGTVYGTTVNLSTGTGNIGSISAPIRLDSGSLVTASAITPGTIAAGTGTNGNVYLSNTGVASVSGGAGGAFNITDNGALSIGPVTSSTMLAQTVSNKALDTITINGNITASTSATLIAGGTASLSEGSTPGTILAPLITLNSGGGNIGSSTAALVVANGVVNSYTTGAGSIYLGAFTNEEIGTATSGSTGTFNFQGAGGNWVTVSGPVSSSGTNGLINILNNGPLLVNNTLTSPNVQIVSTGTSAAGSIYVDGNIHSAGGTVFINAQDSTGGTGGSIVVGNNVQITTLVSSSSTKGTIELFVGTPPTSATSPISSSGKIVVDTSGTGLVYGGANPGQITATGPLDATLNAHGRNVILNIDTPTGSLGSISLGSNSLIKADPPAPATAPLTAPLPTSLTAPLAVDSVLVGATPRVALTPAMTTPFVSGSNAPTNNAGTQPVSFLINNINSQIATSQGAVSAATAIGASARGAASGEFAPQGRRVAQGRRMASPLQGGVSSEQAQWQVGADGILLSPSKDLTLETPLGTVYVAKGAVALVVSNEQKLCVFNMHDNHRGDVRVRSEGQSIALVPGRHLTIAAGKHEFSEVNPFAAIGYRNLHSLAGGNSLFVADFSIISALKNIEALSQLAAGKGSPEIQVREGMLKDAAIIMQTQSKTGGYQRVLKSDRLAAL